MMSWGALFAPAGTPKAVTERIATAARDVLGRAEVRDALERAHFVPRGSTPDELRTFVSQQSEAWRKAVQAAQEMAGWLADGRLKSREDIVEGFDTFPDTLLRLFRGENTGKLLLKVG